MDCVSGSSEIRGKIEFGKRRGPGNFGKQFRKFQWGKVDFNWQRLGFSHFRVGQRYFLHFNSKGLNRQNLVFAKSFTMSLKCPLSNTSVLVDDEGASGWDLHDAMLRLRTSHGSDRVGMFTYYPHTISPSAACIPIVLGCFVLFHLRYPSLLLKCPIYPSTLSAF